MSIRACIQDETDKINEYLRMMTPETRCEVNPSDCRNLMWTNSWKTSWKDKPLHIMHKRHLQKIVHTRQDSRCRRVKEAPATIQHITEGIKMLIGKSYVDHHNKVAGTVSRNTCTQIVLVTPRLDTRPKVVENNRGKIQSDF